MTTPTTKTELLKRMATSHQDYVETLSRIPREHFDEVILYEVWTIKDLIAHIGWWIETGAERVAAVRRGEPLEQFAYYDPINDDILERFKEAPLTDVQAMEARGWQAMMRQVEQASDAELFDADRFESLQGRPLLSLIAEETYDHYDAHLNDLKVAQRVNVTS
jgi:hypothetical protein